MTLEDMIGQVEARVMSDDPLDYLTQAVLLHEAQADISDQMLDHFVRRAREAGCSWAQIGDTLGVTKQAAQQRHGDKALRSFFRRGRSRLFQRFTSRARVAVVEAQAAAREMGHNYVGTEHILIGLFADERSVAARVLAAHDIDAAQVTTAVEELVGGLSLDQPVKGHIPFTPRAKQALEMALKEALDLGHNYIGTEHQLLGLLRVDDGLAARMLNEWGVIVDETRAEIVQLLTELSNE